MALANGVLVHGPRHWACAVRTDEGELKVASGEQAAEGGRRGQSLHARPAPGRRDLRDLPRGATAAARGEPSLPAPACRGDDGRAAWSPSRLSAGRASRPSHRSRSPRCSRLRPAVLALRGTALAEYHGAEHISIGSYEHGEPRTREHERCGSHMIGPLLVTTAAGSAIASRAPKSIRPLARAGAAVGAVAAAVEVFSWMVANERHPLARALARPGHELQQRSGHRRALARAARGRRGRSGRVPAPRIAGQWRWRRTGGGSASHLRSSTSRSRRCGRATTPTSTSTSHARRCSRTGGTRASSCRSSRSSRRCSVGWTRRSPSSSSARTTGTR